MYERDEHEERDDRTWFEKLPTDDQVMLVYFGGLGGLVFFILLLAAL